jgi:hypothetical protein
VDGCGQIARAKAKGVRLGRPGKIDPEKVKGLLRQGAIHGRNRPGKRLNKRNQYGPV